MERKENYLSRRNFIGQVAVCGAFCGCSSLQGDGRAYSVSILGDTHFDAEPRNVYHAFWTPRSESDRRDRENEFARNTAMWSSRLPRLIAAAAQTCRADTAFLLHMGDLIQGDCNNDDRQMKMLQDAAAACTRGFPDIPFLPVPGNHDLRNGGTKAFDLFFEKLAEKAPKFCTSSTSTAFWQGPDAYILLDFMRPDVDLINRLLDKTEGARYTFIVVHSPIAASDTWGPYWFLLGKPKDTNARRALFARLLRRQAIVLCGHLHVTQIRRWRVGTDELVEFCANSVWRQQEDVPKQTAFTPADYGSYSRQHPTPMGEDHDGCHQTRTQAEITALLDEYKQGLVDYRQYRAAGHYLMNVSDTGVEVDFYACDSKTPTQTFTLKTSHA